MSKDSGYDYRQLKRNIGAVRHASGDTQEECSHYLGRSNSLLGNIEGARHNPPSLETLIRFAQRYHVTIDELLFDDFSNMKPIKSILENEELNQKILIYLLPLVSSAEALENETFKKGYELQRKLYHDINSGIELSDDSFVFTLMRTHFQFLHYI